MGNKRKYRKLIILRGLHADMPEVIRRAYELWIGSGIEVEDEFQLWQAMSDTYLWHGGDAEFRALVPCYFELIWLEPDASYDLTGVASWCNRYDWPNWPHHELVPELFKWVRDAFIEQEDIYFYKEAWEAMYRLGFNRIELMGEWLASSIPTHGLALYIRDQIYSDFTDEEKNWIYQPRLVERFESDYLNFPDLEFSDVLAMVVDNLRNRIY